MIIKLASHNMKELLKNRTELTKDELDEVFKRKAVWHHGPKGEETSAIWKSLDVDRSLKEAGRHKTPVQRFIYVTNTHRAMNTAPSLKGAISRFHKFIKSTA